MAAESKDRWFIHSLEKGFACLRTFSPQRPTLSLSEVARANGMNLATARRYLETIRELGYMIRDDRSKNYQLTPKVLRLGAWVIESMDLRSRLVPYMRAMTRDFDVTTGCVILEGTEVVFIERFRSSDVVNLALTAGSRLPSYSTSLGKAILAFLDEAERRSLLDNMDLVPLTPSTITDKQVLWKELQLVAQRGYAVADQELTVGMKSISVPIFNKKRVVEAAFGVSYPSHREQEESFKRLLIKELLEIAQKVSHD